MSPTARREHVRQPGVLMALLLVLLLMFGGHPCSAVAQAGSVPPSNAHDCCPGLFATPNSPHNFSQLPCHDGSCPQAIGHYDVADRYASSFGNPDVSPQPLAAARLLAPDWSNQGHLPLPLIAATTGPPPTQRSIVLRL
ncbi:MAG TPA: hypothetical protein PKY50_06460 [Candidatus Competibacter sp.]|nr:hypothetical protein [Candidatus Competibacter sp.]